MDGRRPLDLSRSSPVVAEPIRWLGPLLAIAGVLGFSFKAILVKLAYALHPLDAPTLLALRMLYASPFFIAMAWWSGRHAAPFARRDAVALAFLGFVGYYLASLLDFTGLRYISASLARLVLFLYPTIVVLLSAVVYKKPITARTAAALVLSYGGIMLVFWNDLQIGNELRAIAIGGALAFGSGFFYAVYLVGAGTTIKRLGSMRFTAWAMLCATAFVLTHFFVTRPPSDLAVPMQVHGVVLAMAFFATVLPVWMIAEAIQRIGANASSLIGSLGPLFTIALAAMILGEPVRAVQLGGAALVLIGVALVTFKR
jgi:drug/metabolite transporter (DMT)-like permease